MAGSKRDTGEVILKVVCALNEPQTATIALAGTSKRRPSSAGVRAHVQDGRKMKNSFEEPTKVVPQETTFEGVSDVRLITRFHHNSVTDHAA